MKRKLLIAALVIGSSVPLVAQLYTPNNSVNPVGNGSSTNVGIGVQNPSFQLEVLNQLRIQGNEPELILGRTNDNFNPSIYSYGVNFANDNLCFAINNTAGGGIPTSSFSSARLRLFTSSSATSPSMLFETRPPSGSFASKMALTTDGNLGIGTSSPTTRLFILEPSAGQFPGGASPSSGILISGNNTGGSLNMGIDGNGTLGPFYSWIQSRNRLTQDTYNLSLNPSGGNVGIGVVNPQTKLTIMEEYAGAAPNGTGINSGIVVTGNSTGGSLNMGIDASGTFYSWIQSRNRVSQNYYNLSLNPFGGNVGIGTTNPDQALTVKGIIHTNEVRVDLNSPIEQGPDYVFEPAYNLLPLSEVESYIKANKHLPEVPSAKDMEEEGLNLKEMNLLLLKKVEELTLYVIEQQKEIKNLKQKVYENN